MVKGTKSELLAPRVVSDAFLTPDDNEDGKGNEDVRSEDPHDDEDEHDVSYPVYNFDDWNGTF